MNPDALRFYGVAVLLAPLAAAILIGLPGPKLLRSRSHWVGIFGVLAALGAAAAILLAVYRAPLDAKAASIPIYTWITTGSPAAFGFEFLIDPLTAIMLVTVTFVSLLVFVYSRDYMRHDGHAVRGYERFFAFLALFVFSMCALVLAGNFLLLYLGWEAVGLCSYLLIGFYYDRPAAAAAAKKAFLVNRVGDFGFGLGILLIYLTFGTLEFQAVFRMVQEGVAASGEPLSPARITTMALLLFCGACGKSAQLPLHVWLPDAMEGPSPVSALIHAATMVTAGVYMVARCGAIFTASATAMSVVAVLGAMTAFFAATIALVQTDMKRVLAYSTISQLGYMFLGLGVYAADSAIFHLFTHAFFKALLFLGAGSVMHALGGMIDVRSFSGLRTVLPWTYRTFVIGALALAGFPLLSGFFSKDEILHHALTVNPVLAGLGLVTALLTSFYTFRLVFLAFHGPKRIPEAIHPHECRGWMRVALLILSLGAVGAGYLGSEGTGTVHGLLSPVFASTFAAAAETFHSAVEPHAGFWSHYRLMMLSGTLSILGILAAYILYVRGPWLASLIRASVPESYQTLWNKYYFDEFYGQTIVEPARRGARLCVGLDDYFIDGLLWVITAVPRGLALALRGLQSGILQGYALSMVLGMTIILFLILSA
jgi:NADH-quinone oxidoreductase subunit L